MENLKEFNKFINEELVDKSNKEDASGCYIMYQDIYTLKSDLISALRNNNIDWEDWNDYYLLGADAPNSIFAYASKDKIRDVLRNNNIKYYDIIPKKPKDRIKDYEVSYDKDNGEKVDMSIGSENLFNLMSVLKKSLSESEFNSIFKIVKK